MNAHFRPGELEHLLDSGLQAEQSLLGTCLTNPETFGVVMSQVDAEQFGEDLHGSLWMAMQQMAGEGRPVNVTTLCAKLGNPPIGTGKLSHYLAKCWSESTCAPPYALDYARQIRTFWALRKIATLGADAMSGANAPGTEAKDLISHLIQELDETRARMERRSIGFSSAASVVVEVVDQMAAHYAGTAADNAVSTGLHDLDAKLSGGFRPGDLVIVAGRPGMGKSLVSVSVSRQAAVKGHAGAFFSLEMAKAQIGARFLSDHLFDRGAPLNSNQILYAKFGEYEAQRVIDAGRDFAELPLEIDDSSNLTVGEIGARARNLSNRLARQGKRLEFIVIDYLKFLRASDRYRGQRHYEVGEISVSLKSLAKDMGCAVILLAQLNRGVESREDKRPQLSDLRESGDLEADADVVMFLYREEYYLAMAEPKMGTEEHGEWMFKMAQAANKLEINVAKQRMGPTGAIEVYCHPGASAVRDAQLSSHLPLVA